MSLTYGFYNSINEDRKYNASQMAKLFDGVLNDGIFMSIGDKLMVSANTGMNVSVGTGRAWFDHTWTLNDSILVLPVSESEILLNRIDIVVLEVNNTEAVRANSIKIIKGTGATVPVAPDLINNSEIHQYPLAHIYVGVGVTEILQANITNYVGTAVTPFATGVMQTMSIDALVAQWQSEWDVWSAEQQQEFLVWLADIESRFSEADVAILQAKIDAISPTNQATSTNKQILQANGDGTSTFIDFSGGGQLLGTATVKTISYNAQTIGENITIPATYNAMSVGDITILDGYTVTLEEGAVWKVV